MPSVFYGVTAKQKHWLLDSGIKFPVKFHPGSLTLNNLPHPSTQIISVHTDSKVTKEILAKLPNLKLIVTRTAGVDHIDLTACKLNKVSVANCAGLNAEAVAEFTFGLLLNYLREIPQGLILGHALQFGKEHLTGIELSGKTLVVVGTGAVGSRVAQIGKGFGMNIIGYDNRKNMQLVKSTGMRYLGLKQAFQKADVVSLHIPSTPMTEKIINRDLLARLKPGAVMVNTARGSLVDTRAIIRALDSGRLGAYLTDVLDYEHHLRGVQKVTNKEKEQIKLQKQLVRHPNVWTTPHMAHDTEEAAIRIFKHTIELIKAFKKGQKIPLII